MAQELGLDRPALVGYSWGALLALLYAVEAVGSTQLAPPSSLFLIDPAPLTRAYRLVSQCASNALLIGVPAN